MPAPVFIGLAIYGIYFFVKQVAKTARKPSLKNQEHERKESDQEAQAAQEIVQEMRDIASMIYHKKLDWSDYIDQISAKTDTPEEMIHVLLMTNSFVYEQHRIASAGFWVAEKKLEQVWHDVDPTTLTMGQNFAYFVIGSGNGKVLFFKNEFYENKETGETRVVSVCIEDVLSPVVATILFGGGEKLIIVYKNGLMSELAKKASGEILERYRQFQLGPKLIHFSALSIEPIFLSIDEHFQTYIWCIEDETMHCYGFGSLKILFDAEHKVFLNAALTSQTQKPFFTVYVAIDNKADKKIEIYKSEQGVHTLMAIIAYEGSILCSHFVASKYLFTFYQKGGDGQGVHVYNFELQHDVAYFTPESMHGQYPVQLALQKDKIFCLYQNGFMDMWHCDVNRRSMAHEILTEIVAPLPYTLKIEFLRQFGVYLQDRTAQNCKLLMQIGSAGLPEKEIGGMFVRLQFLHREM